MGSNRVNRGGSWNNSATNCRVANRNNNNPTNSNNNIGFRVARSSKVMFEQIYVLSQWAKK
jgi:formylglycine-generating enzyme required for sulfatase activity